jgi:hypothetical protein
MFKYLKCIYIFINTKYYQLNLNLNYFLFIYIFVYFNKYYCYQIVIDIFLLNILSKYYDNIIYFIILHSIFT